MKVLSVPRPSNDTQNQELCSVQHLVQLLEERRPIFRQRMTDDTASISQKRFVDTTNVCVIAAQHVMDLLHKKRVATIRKLEAAARRKEMQKETEIRSPALAALISKNPIGQNETLCKARRVARSPVCG